MQIRKIISMLKGSYRIEMSGKYLFIGSQYCPNLFTISIDSARLRFFFYESDILSDQYYPHNHTLRADYHSLRSAVNDPEIMTGEDELHREPRRLYVANAQTKQIEKIFVDYFGDGNITSRGAIVDWTVTYKDRVQAAQALLNNGSIKFGSKKKDRLQKLINRNAQLQLKN